jgi:phospholipase C
MRTVSARAVKLLAVIGALWCLAAWGGSGTNQAELVQRAAAQPFPIQHIIVIMQENRSFDSNFGTFPCADGIPMQDGIPTVCIPADA